MSTEQRGIGSVEVGGQLLRVLTEADGPMMLRDLAASAGMTAAKAHPYMVSYMRLGLVEQDRASGRYELGPLALQMGLASMRRLNPVRVATEAIAELVLRINKTVALSVWGNQVQRSSGSRRGQAPCTSTCVLAASCHCSARRQVGYSQLFFRRK